MPTAVPIQRQHEKQSPALPEYRSKDELRTSFALAMSAMYKAEVPLYGQLMSIVKDVNDAVCRETNISAAERLDLERHGAIRLGTPYELQTTRRVFSLFGLQPVGYYDLSAAGLPMHATAFRPITQKSLDKNPFRVFTTLLRPELLSPEARNKALTLLRKRNIFTDELIKLIEVGEQQAGLFDTEQGERFVVEAVKTFCWQAVAASTMEEYNHLRAEHPILADIACFNSAHINHLTPRTLDIVAAEAMMRADGLSVKSRIEGPPIRKYPILLRQTSFLALEEPIRFRSDGPPTGFIEGNHKARFGEIEQRGAAVTVKGRRLYDGILEKAMKRIAIECYTTQGRKRTDQIIAETFREYPDDLDTLIREGLIYCTFRRVNVNTDATTTTSSIAAKLNSCCWNPSSVLPLKGRIATLSSLLSHHILEAVPLTYEDFLPLSAAGIFMSNLQKSPPPSASSLSVDSSSSTPSPAASQSGESDSDNEAHPSPQTTPDFTPFPDQTSFEEALGCSVHDPNALYAQAQADSLKLCAKELGVDRIIFDFQDGDSCQA